ncbi:MAG: MATE family efflux transporter, partial [Planctomycetota bacterium]|jgi:Na+-driven multidrug efflux pump
VSTVYGGVIAAVMGLCFFLFYKPIIGLFFIIRGADPELLAHSRDYLAILCPAYPFIAAGLVLSHAFNGAGDTKTPLVFDTITFILLQIPIALLLMIVPVGDGTLGLKGVYLAMTLTSVVSAFLYAFWFRLGRWKRQQIE